MQRTGEDLLEEEGRDTMYVFVTMIIDASPLSITRLSTR
jgi:hypothetical protein